MSVDSGNHTAGLDAGSGDPNTELWRQSAEWWQREFTDGVDPEYTEQILPIVTSSLSDPGLVLDVGTGEGQVARALVAHGHQVAGVDPIESQVVLAQERSMATQAGSSWFAQAAAAGLPFRSDSFDHAVACLVFEHIDDVDGAISELARVVRPGGTFLFLLNHPLLQTPGSGWIDDQIIEPPEQYWRIGPYLVETATVEEVQKDVHIRFVHRPLSRYVNTLADHGFVLVEMMEPSPPPSFLAQAPEYEDASTIPRLMVLRLKLR